MRHHFEGDHYTMHILAGIISAQVLILLCVHFWPLIPLPEPMDTVDSSPDVIELEEIASTSQVRRSPPPVRPSPPVIMPEDVILNDDLTLDYSPLEVGVPSDPDELPVRKMVSSEPPKPIRIVTPEYPRPARRRKIHAEIVVTFVVDKHGHVQSPRILERYLLDQRHGTRVLVDELGYGLEDAALRAALRSLFRPARSNDVPVGSNHELTFKFGL